MVLTLMSCSEEPVALDRTINENFRQLDQKLPTASPKDTEQTRLEVGVFRALFLKLCPEFVCQSDK